MTPKLPIGWQIGRILALKLQGYSDETVFAMLRDEDARFEKTGVPTLGDRVLQKGGSK